MFELKTLSPEAVPRALAKAERYRLLNEPGEAESICLDALGVDPTNQEAIAMLLLAITDQFDADPTRVDDAWKTVDRLTTSTSESITPASSTSGAQRRSSDTPRRAAVRAPTSGSARRWSVTKGRKTLRPPNNDDALLRWNACARLIMSDHHLVPMSEEPREPLLLE